MVVVEFDSSSGYSDRSWSPVRTFDTREQAQAFLDKRTKGLRVHLWDDEAYAYKDCVLISVVPEPLPHGEPK